MDINRILSKKNIILFAVLFLLLLGVAWVVRQSGYCRLQAYNRLRDHFVANPPAWVFEGYRSVEEEKKTHEMLIYNFYYKRPETLKYSNPELFKEFYQDCLKEKFFLK